MRDVFSIFGQMCLIVCVAIAIDGCRSDQPHRLNSQVNDSRSLPSNQLTPIERLMVIDRISTPSPRELSVQPLRDNAIVDLLESAQNQRAAGALNAAQITLDQALQISPKDPLALQARAEIAAFKAEWEKSEEFAHRAAEYGSHDGPLCRRHWATVEQARLALGHAQEAAWAHETIETCRVGRPESP